MNANSKELPCPFCGSDDQAFETICDDDGDHEAVRCNACGASGPHKPTEEEAEAAFDAQPAVAALEIARDRLARWAQLLMDQPRPDEEAIAAVPELRGKRAIVLYFETDADRAEFVALIHEAKPGMRTVKI